MTMVMNNWSYTGCSSSQPNRHEIIFQDLFFVRRLSSNHNRSLYGQSSIANAQTLDRILLSPNTFNLLQHVASTAQVCTSTGAHSHLVELQLKDKIEFTRCWGNHWVWNGFDVSGASKGTRSKTEINKAYGFEHGTWAAYTIACLFKRRKLFSLLTRIFSSLRCELFVAPWRV